MRRSLIVILMTLSLSSCFRPEPEGPAERIGKSIDQFAQGVNDLSNDPNYVGDSHNREKNNVQGSSNENYRSDDYWAKSDEYWREHDPKKVFKNNREEERDKQY